ncbi:MAG: hypothetical protein H4O13_11835 [Xanthomonadales bacterium]|nr:hypothetical protein [Xanthomonadales bacterium]
MSASSIVCRIASSLGFGFVMACGVPALARAQSASVELGEGLWVQSEDQRVYLSNPQGFPEARDLKDGRVLWTSPEPALLLAPVDKRWLALGQAGKRGEGRLLVIDALSGAVQKRIDFNLPEGVSAAVSAEPLRRFDVRAEARGERVRLHWSYIAYPFRGALLTTDGGAVASEGLELQGVLDVDISAANPAVQSVPEAASMASLRTPDLAADEQLADLGARQFRSADDTHAMAAEARPDATFGTAWRWQLASRREGLLDVTLDLPFAYAPFLVNGDLLIYRAPSLGYLRSTGAWQQEGLRVVVHALTDGREAWAAELLDREFRGTLPP